MKTKTLSEEISYNLKTYLNDDTYISANTICSIGAKYFIKMETINEIIQSFEKHKMTNDYITIINEMMFYVKKAFYKKQCNFNSFSKYMLDKFFDIKISELLNSNQLEDECHTWCIEILQRCNYRY